MLYLPKTTRRYVMILDISDASFKNILNDKSLYLPIRWNGSDFAFTLGNLFNHYIKQVESLPNESGYYANRIHVNVKDIKRVCGLLTKAVNHYLNGFPSKAYSSFERVMDVLMDKPLKIYQKSVMEQFEIAGDRYGKDDDLKLFRVVSVEDNKPYSRVRVFHTPYNLRSKVSTSRYSIAGYPSLYLGTTLALCCEEIHMNPHQNFALASIFKLERTLEYTNTNIRVIELGVKPQDFLNVEYNNESHERRISHSLLESSSVRSAYLLWYPLIASCSYIRTNKNDPFAAEYIIPQLLMQWVRNEIGSSKGDEYDQLVGIRYFSCASVKASDMGFNYVFPTSGQQKSAELPYCSVLAKAFRLTNPVYIHEHDNLYTCEWSLIKSDDFDFITSR